MIYRNIVEDFDDFCEHQNITLIFHVHSKLIRSVGGARSVSPKHMRWMWLEQASVFSVKTNWESHGAMEKNKGPRRLSMKWVV